MRFGGRAQSTGVTAGVRNQEGSLRLDFDRQAGDTLTSCSPVQEWCGKNVLGFSVCVC